MSKNRSVSFFEAKEHQPDGYSLTEHVGWDYEDRCESELRELFSAGRRNIIIENRYIMGLNASRQPHLVMSDLHMPRFALWYNIKKNGDVLIQFFQRLRTQYEEVSRNNRTLRLRWSPELEKQKQAELSEVLGGMHPTEFIVSEVLWRQREQIKSQLQKGSSSLHGCALRMPGPKSDYRHTYRTIADRFFCKPDVDGEYWPLSLDKQRVKQIVFHGEETTDS